MTNLEWLDNMTLLELYVSTVQVNDSVLSLLIQEEIFCRMGEPARAPLPSERRGQVGQPCPAIS